MNVAVIVLDTMRKDVFDEHFDWLPGVRYEEAYSTGSYTVPAHGSLFTGAYPSEVGAHSQHEYLPDDRPTLAGLLSDAGYRTRCFSANPLISHLFEFTRGFDETEYGWHILNALPETYNWSKDGFFSGPLRYPESVVRAVLDGDSRTLQSLKAGYEMFRAEDDGAAHFLRKLRSWSFGESEFLFANLMEVHSPYWAPPEYATTDARSVDMYADSEKVLAGDFDSELFWRAYNDCARYLSEVYRDIFDELTDEFDVVVTLSDHGELFGEHDLAGHRYGLYDELTHVPLVVSDGRGGRETVRETASLVDVFQTVLGLCDVDAPAETAGHDLRALPSDREAMTEFHGLRPLTFDQLRENGFPAQDIERYDEKLRGIAFAGYYGHEDVSGFVEYADPGGVDPRSRLDAHARDSATVGTPRADRELADSTKSQLSKLGYI
ncbi:sulfatase-like hydrolase/transferase [Haloferax sp. Q22]|uniref:sulfatase-like hydrolase/transferase n=1 Tax=Haloferax sp. (strain Q22) TaxID=1526048 RepID=UPI000737CFB5|nr:sulfatase-like hydrolase/transferase [Haloferax sp. Q22]